MYVLTMTSGYITRAQCVKKKIPTMEYKQDGQIEGEKKKSLRSKS